VTAWEDLVGAAPPALLRARLISDAEEVLVLTYTCDLSFFEDVCLREARAVRARTTVLFDANRLTAGPIQPRPAEYLALPVVCKGGGAFHPKLVVIASESDAVVAIGSGNATAAGWHYNAEVWTLLRGDGPTVPMLFHHLADWLRQLPEGVWMEDLGRERLDRVADLLTARPADGHPGEPVLVTSTVRPIIEQLPMPSDPVTALAVAAPFFDPRAKALARLIRRFQPDELSLLLTRDVQCDPKALADAAKLAPITTAKTPETIQYHHAKIIEWWTGTDGWALTGSANCSQAALTKTMVDGGNCELGVLSPIGSTVIGAVASDEVDLQDLADLNIRKPEPDHSSADALRVFGVRISADRVEATILVRHGEVPRWVTVSGLRLDHHHSDGSLHVYVANPRPDWMSAMAGLSTTHVTTDTDIELRDVLVTDVEAALARIDQPSPLEHTPFHELVADPAQLAALVDALTHLASVRPDRVPGTSPGTSGRRQIEARVKGAVGPALLRFALGLDTHEQTSTSTDEEMFEGSEQTATAEPGPAAPTTDVRPGSVTTVVDLLSEAQRTRLRRDIEKLVDDGADWSLPAKLAVCRVVLLVAASGLWREPADWYEIVYEAVSQLWSADQEETLDHEHAALAIIGLVTLHCVIELCGEPDSEVAAQFETLRRSYQEWADWLKAAPEDALRRYSAGLGGHTFGLFFERTRFADELDWILSRDALHDAVDRLSNAHISVDSVVRVATSKNTRRAVLAALDALRDFPDVHVVAEGRPEVHGWWNGRRLLLVTRVGAAWQAELWSQLLTGIATYGRGVPLRSPDRRWSPANPEAAMAQTSSTP
jgi:hypothetical protein